MSVQEANRLLGISDNTGGRLVRSGRYPGLIRIGRRVRIGRPAIERILTEGAVIATPPRRPRKPTISRAS